MLNRTTKGLARFRFGNTVGGCFAPRCPSSLLKRTALQSPLNRMFRNAVIAHGASNNEKEEVTVSRPQSSSVMKPIQSRVGWNSHALNPSKPTKLNGQRSQERLKVNKDAIKRSVSGLAQAIGSDSQDSFQDLPQGFGTREDPLVIENSPKPKWSQNQENVFFDEQDFDSDIDLEEDDLSGRTTIKYPALPNTASSSTSASAESLPRQSQTKTGRDFVPSSAALPWSSSPARPAPNQSELVKPGSQEQTPTAHNAHLKRALDISETPPHRLTKRRTLPWNVDVRDGDLRNDARDASTRAESAAQMSADRTDQANQLSSPHGFPWTASASTIKEKQKNLRKTQKKSLPNDGNLDTTNSKSIVSKAMSPLYLSNEQRHILNLVTEEGKSVFFTGSAGTGKSVLLREIIKTLKEKFVREQDRVAVTASTGLAACNVGGVTLHSFAGIGLGKEDVPELVKKIKRNQKARQRWLRTKVLVVDEVSMVDGELFDKLEEVARRVRNNGRPFGGIQLVVTGDFFQLPPVPDNGSGKEATFAFDAAQWTSTVQHTICLHQVFRQKDPMFAMMLNEMREGRMSPASISAWRRLDRRPDWDDKVQATELFPLRQQVERANNDRMIQLHGESRRFEARDGGAIVDKTQRDRLLQNCMAPQVLELKKGSQVMLIKNMDDTLVNGSLGHVVGFMNEATWDAYDQDPDDFTNLQNAEPDELNPEQLKKKRMMALSQAAGMIWPLVRFTMSDGTTRDMLCNRETWKIELPNGEVQASRSQVPLILAWALSIHKAQGQTLERVRVDLGKIFEKGQAYVALSRATTMEGLQVLNFDPNKVRAHDRVRQFYAQLSRAEYGGAFEDAL